MKYNLQVLFFASSEEYSNRKQLKEVTVEADGFRITGDGRIYEFFTQDGDNGSTRKTVSCYPTANTIIESIR